MLCEPVHTSILIRRWSDLEWLIWPPDFFRAFRSAAVRHVPPWRKLPARKDVDVLGASRCEFPTEFYRNIRGARWIREKYRKYVEKNTRRYMVREFLRYNTPHVDDIFNVAKFRQAGGFRDDTHVFFYNHHESHALATLFYTQWDDALLVTADAGGDSVNYSHRHFADGALKTIYGGEECLVSPLPIDSIAYAYMTMTGALGFTPLRHEGKLTGLAAYGQPILADKIAARFSVDESGRVFSDFSDYPEMENFIHALAKGVSREDASTSNQDALERLPGFWNAPKRATSDSQAGCSR